MKKIIFMLAVLGLVLLPNSISAQVAPTPTDVTCYFTNQNLTVGSIDASTGGQVTVLQSFLVAKGFLVMPVGVSTGYFGSITQNALAKYQASVGVSPSVGYFGPITRGYINSHCSVGIPVPGPGPIPIITGTPPVISTVSAPTILGVNTIGTWSVSASDPNGGTLTYSVDWGDVSNCPPNLACKPVPQLSSSASAVFQQSASFTHSYSSAGTYTQTFTVRDSSGQQAQTTTNVQVTYTTPGIY